MPINARILGFDGAGDPHLAHVHQRSTHNMLLVQTDRRLQFDPTLRPFLNPTNGAAMNKDVSFGSIPAILHDGGTSSSAITGTADSDQLNKLQDATGGFTANVSIGMTVENTNDNTYARISAIDLDTRLSLTTVDGTASSDIFPDGTDPYIIDAVWIGNAVAGSWNFAGGDISLTNGGDNDEALFETESTNDEKLLSDYVALTMSVNLGTYDSTRHDMSIQLMLDGTVKGTAVNLNDFIDTGNFNAQQAVISIADAFEATGQCNGIRFLVSRSGGAKPAIDFDNIQFETGTAPLVYRMNVNKGEVFHVTSLRFNFADNETSILTDVNAFALSFDKLLSISALANGIGFRRQTNRETGFAVTLRQLSDFLGAASDIQNFTSDGTNTYFTLVVDFPESIILVGSNDDHITLTIQDNLSSLLLFTAAAVGALEV